VPEQNLRSRGAGVGVERCRTGSREAQDRQQGGAGQAAGRSGIGSM